MPDAACIDHPVEGTTRCNVNEVPLQLQQQQQCPYLAQWQKDALVKGTWLVAALAQGLVQVVVEALVGCNVVNDLWKQH